MLCLSESIQYLRLHPNTQAKLKNKTTLSTTLIFIWVVSACIPDLHVQGCAGEAAEAEPPTGVLPKGHHKVCACLHAQIRDVQ